MKSFLTYLTKPLVLFYVVFAYIIIFSIWWSVLLFQKNRLAFDEKVMLNAIHSNMDLDEFVRTDEFSVEFDKFKRQRFMIITEGATFMLLIIIGLYMVRKSFKRELELASQQSNFLLSITHELKSPLAGIKMAIQTMLRRKLEPNQKEILLNNSMEDVDRLEALVENLLLAAKFDNPSYGFSLEEVSLNSILNSVIVQMRAKYKNHEVNVLGDLEREISILGDKLALSSVIINLVENACKYSEKAKDPKVEVELKDMGSAVLLSVADNGVGISLHEKDKVFDKFYRIGSENIRQTKGTGLGLFIVKRVVDMYGGFIEIADNNPKGTIFRATLPRNNSESFQQAKVSIG